MKKKIYMAAAAAVLGILLFSQAAFAKSGRAYNLRVSYATPQDAKAGFSFGGTVGTIIDKPVELGLGTNLYYRYYRKTTQVATDTYESGIDTSTVVMNVEYHTVIIPLMAELFIKLPAFWPGSFFGHGGVGYELLWNKEQNYETKASESRLYGGFTWEVGAGLSFRLGEKSAIYAEGFYNNGKVRKKNLEIKKDLPVYDEVNLSGVGARVGISLGPL